MRQRLTSIMIVMALILSMFLPVHAQASAPAQSQASLQGEIAYVLNGDIWLLDLVTGKSRQLGDLAAQFRAAYLLETLAAVQAQRAYADGVTATFRLPNGVELLN